MYSGPPLESNVDISVQGRDVIKRCGEIVPQVVFGNDTKIVLVELLRVLHEEHALREGNSLLTDRTFLVKAVKVLKANALLNGRLRCEPQDLMAMRHLTTFRVPEKVHEQIEAIIAEVLRKQAASGAPPPGDDPGEPTGDVAQEQAGRP